MIKSIMERAHHFQRLKPCTQKFNSKDKLRRQNPWATKSLGERTLRQQNAGRQNVRHLSKSTYLSFLEIFPVLSKDQKVNCEDDVELKYVIRNLSIFFFAIFLAKFK